MSKGFQIDYTNTFDDFHIPNGEYEAVIKTVGEDVTPNGAEFCQFTLVIRNDVDQPKQNGRIFHKVWRSKQDGKYNPIHFNTIAKAAGLENGKVYPSFDALLQDYEGKPVRVKVKNETSEYNGKTYENLNVKTWMKTKFNGPVRHEWKDDEKRGGYSFPSDQEINISDDDLPF